MIDFRDVPMKARKPEPHLSKWARFSDLLAWALARLFAAVFLGLMAAAFLGGAYLAWQGPAP